MKKYKHIIMDLDGTMCPSRQIISSEMGHLLTMLKRNGHTLSIVSGAEVARIKKQICGLEPDHMLGQCGSESPFWKHKLTERDEVEVLRHIRKIQRRMWEYDFGDDISSTRFVENRGSQITFSLTGFDCDPKTKAQFDPTTKRRRVILDQIPFVSLTLEAKVAGNTSIDYTHKEFTKGKNIERLIKHMGWYKNECVYIGDRFYPGGNDETVKGVIDCIVVEDPEDCLKKLVDFV